MNMKTPYKWNDYTFIGLLELTATMSVYMMNANILLVMEQKTAPDARHFTPRKK